MPYWINTGNKTHGPFEAAQLKKIALKGELKRNHKISTDQKKWTPAESVKGLKWRSEETSLPSGADLFVGDADHEEYQLAPESPGPPSSLDEADQWERSEHNVEWQVCPKCNESLMQIRNAGELIGKTLCPACDLSDGLCPVCQQSLELTAAHECANCRSSWHSNALDQSDDTSVPARNPESVEPDLDITRLAKRTGWTVAEFGVRCTASLILGPIAGSLCGLILGMGVDSLLQLENHEGLVALVALGFCAGLLGAISQCFSHGVSLVNSFSADLGEALGENRMRMMGQVLVCLLFSAMVFGGTYFYYRNWNAGTHNPPMRTSLSQMPANGVPENRFVIIEDAKALGRPVKVKSVYYVALHDPSATAIKDVRVVAKIWSDNLDSIAVWQGLLIDNASLLTDHEEELNAQYPGIDLQNCLILWVGDKPGSISVLVGLCFVGMAFVAGAFFLAFRFVWSFKSAIEAASKQGKGA